MRTKKHTEKKRIFNLVIVDESGSMDVIYRQTLAGINETLGTIRKMQEVHPDMEQRVTLLTFDSNRIHFIYDNEPAFKAHDITANDYNPRSATPLYDAIGKGIAHVNACAGPHDNVLVTIITDGEENCSCEYTKQMVDNLIKKLKKQNWTFAFIGTDDLNVRDMAGDIGIKSHRSFSRDDEGAREMFRDLSDRRIQFYEDVLACRVFEDYNFFAEDVDTEVKKADDKKGNNKEGN